MNINTYEDASTDLDMDIDLDLEEDIDADADLIFDTGIAGFEIAYGSKNKEMIKKNLKRSARQQYQTRQKLDSIREKRTFEKENNSFSDYWDS
ncbi:hypothetical protein Q4506_15355 [Colwellia sp. 4_MG-2023]|jgi:hypothetical protein|uniref:hypothetical protein n=1 Tax=unclassified Colwellia TaxID=196834 RepID=UPI001C09B313|nr:MULTISPECIES: hypothetical protein [unclassified Colwellia]MBU2923825.1 hypothetical protein [Colwellia sp. C2M11]MDO6488212.1 hypothetical protein [Colwellia sp. 6_MG-2023]MDO6508454.1 hypothetical protein [Colwellia sp. 5_MG-2023]MDO6557060.1 hypothetical protein [Colwellia sp. 4_MG-2023]MDO6651901.1 hypothetical protein [Colwellia sp. 3_MG-2023]